MKLGLGGVEEVNGLGELSAVEQKGVDELIPILEGNIKKVCLLLAFKSAPESASTAREHDALPKNSSTATLCMPSRGLSWLAGC